MQETADKLALAKINIMGNDGRKKFATAAQDNIVSKPKIDRGRIQVGSKDNQNFMISSIRGINDSEK